MSSLIRPVVTAARHVNVSSASSGLDTSTLFHTAGICDSDHVVVIGRNALDHLIALNRLNCRSVTVLHPDRSRPAIDRADVIWAACATKADLTLLPLVQNTQGVRTVVIEVSGIDEGNRLPTLLKALRFEGFIHVTSHETADRRAVIASRPDWLHWIV